MIEKNQNVKSKQLGRIVDCGDGWKQITISDQRFYKKLERNYPSVSFILQFYPKGKFFEGWLKNNGENADAIAAEAAEAGTNVHKAIENMLEGFEPQWIGQNGNANYSLEEWLMILKFAEFWNTHKPRLVHSELHIFSDTYGFAGTIDLILEINGELWLIDIKTSNSLHLTYELQTAAYATAWNEHNPDRPIKHTGILHLKAATRKPDKTGGKIQGRGWQLKTFDRPYPESFEIFKNVQAIFNVEIPNPVPLSEQYPNSCRLNIEDGE